MDAELDRRIAVEVMGERQPNWCAPVGKPPPVCVPETSQGGAWWRGSWNHEWKPFPFSSDIDQALRALDKYLADWKPRNPNRYGKPFFSFSYVPDQRKSKRFYAKFWDVGVGEYGQTLPEAICNLLLALVQDDKESGG